MAPSCGAPATRPRCTVLFGRSSLDVSVATYEIPSLIDVLATDYEVVTLDVEGVPDIRVLVATGVLVARLAL